MARAGLRKLAILARTAGSSQIVLRRFDEVRDASSRYSDEIGSLDIGERGAVGPDPTGREIMERQFIGSSLDPMGRETMMSQFRDESHKAERTDDRIVALSEVRTTR